MANITVTNTFVNGTVADGTEVNTNFSDIISGTSDGTKDFSISALTIAGVLTANGAVTLGNASGDDIVITGSIAGHIPIKTDDTYDLGAVSLAVRASYSSDFFGSLGAAATPSFSFGGDKNTGMWSSTADVLNWSTAGVERLELDATSLDCTVDANFPAGLVAAGLVDFRRKISWC